MDTLSLAACVIQFLDFTCGLVGKSIAIYESAAGCTVDHDELQSITDVLLNSNEDITKSLEEAQNQRRLTSNEEDLKKIATECQHIAEELLEVLDHLKSKGHRTKWKSFRQAVRSVCKEGKVQSLESRLDRFRQQMVLNVLNSLRHAADISIQKQSSINESVKKIEDILRRSVPVGEHFVRQMMNEPQWRKDLLRAIHEDGIGQINVMHLNQLVNSRSPHAMRAQEERIRSRVVHKLAFSNMTDRERRIPKAHEKTFEWIFEDPDASTRPWSSFKQFLQGADSKIYWITGKPGSGKSTLMKFIRYNSRTSSLIERWGASQDVIQAAFYFWNSGSQMQMSVDGLLQTLLHDCLRQLPRFVQETLPERWEAATLFDVDDFPWSFDEVAHALRRLMVEVCPDKKFFLVIDGLDECTGNQTRLIELVHELSEEIPNLKLCLASRPYYNFDDAFRGRPSLMLQDLTRADMECYVTSKFNANEGFAELQIREPDSVQELLGGILKKSEGVFLWVCLVVRSLLAGLTNGDGLRELHSRLAELPPDLEDLYENILHHLDPRYLDHASRLFQIVRSGDESPTLLYVALADLEDDQHAMHAPVKPLTSTERSAICKNMRRKLISRCHGLLDISSSFDLDEVSRIAMTTSATSVHGDERNGKNASQGSDRSGILIADQEVQYLHRSVRDYIENPRVWSWLLSVNEKPFNASLALLRSSLLQLKHLPEDLQPASLYRSFWSPSGSISVSSDSVSGSRLGRYIWTAIKYAKRSLEVSKENDKQMEIISLLDELEKTTAHLMIPMSGSSVSALHGTVRVDVYHWSSFFLRNIPRPTFLKMMAVCGVHQYLAANLSISDVLESRHNIETDAPFIVTALEGEANIPGDWRYDIFLGPHLETFRLILQKGGDCHQQFKGRSAWSVAKRRTPAINSPKYPKYRMLLELFQEFGGQPPHSRAPAESTPPSLKDATLSSESSSASDNSDLEVEDQHNAEFAQEIKPRRRQAKDSYKSGSGTGRSKASSRRYDDRSFHEATVPRAAFPSPRPRHPPPSPRPHPPHYSYSQYHGHGSYADHTHFGYYAPNHHHYAAPNYHEYQVPVMPPWIPVQRYAAPPPANPFLPPLSTTYMPEQFASYRSGWRGRPVLTRGFVPPYYGSGYL